MKSDKKRIDFIDALKALAIFMIVFNHVRIFSFGLTPNSSTLSVLFVNVMVALFFFVSGLFSNIYESVSVRTLIKRIGNKIRTLLIPTVAFYCVYKLFTGSNWTPWGGYWFTFALFVMFILCYVIKMVIRAENVKFVRCLFLFVSLALLGINVIVKIKVPYIPVGEVTNNFVYFVLGTFVSGKYEKLYRLLNRDLIITSIILLFITLTFLQCNGIPRLFAGIDGVVWHINAILAISILYVLFWKYNSWLSSDHNMSKAVRYVGVNTLSIYMIHYFWLPDLTNLIGMKEIMEGNSVVEFLFIGLLTSVVIMFSLLTDKIIKLSPFLSYWLVSVNKYKQVG